MKVWLSMMIVCGVINWWNVTSIMKWCSVGLCNVAACAVVVLRLWIPVLLAAGKLC